MKTRSNPFIRILTAVAGIATVNCAQATNYWFDNNGTDPGFGVSNGATYDWVTTTPAWSTSGTGVGTGLTIWPAGSSNDAFLSGSGAGETYTIRLGADGTTGTSLRSFGINLNPTATGPNGFGNVNIGQAGDTGAMTLTGNMSLGALNGGTLTVNTPIAANSRSLTFRGGNVILNGAISANNSTGGAIILQAGSWGLDSGTLTLAGANVGSSGTSSYGGTTVFSGYTLNLDYSTQNNNKISDSRPLTFGSATATDGGAGGVVNLNGGTHLEVVSATALNAGAAKVSRSSGASILRTNAITRNTGGTIDFSDFPGAAGDFVQTDTLNVNGILGGYATLSGTDWAINKTGAADGAITALATYTSDVWAAANNVTVTTSSAPAAGSTANSLRFHAAAANTVTLSGSNSISSGGILVTGNVGDNPSSIAGGTLVGASGKDLVVIQNNTSNGLTISSAIADNSASALTKSGAGLLTLSGTNTYTGQTYINAGTLSIGSNANLGAEATGAQLNLNGGTLQATASFGLHNGTAGVNNRNLLLMGRGTIDVTAGNELTIAGPVSGIYPFIKTGSGTLTLSGASNTCSGGAVLSGGTLNINNTGAAGTGALVFNASHTTSSIANGSGAPVTIPNNLIASTTAGAGISFSGAGDLTTTGTAVCNGINPSIHVTGPGKLTVASLNADSPQILSKQGAGALAITGAAGANMAAADLRSGTLIVGNKASLGTGAFTFSTTDGTALQSSGNLTGANRISNEIALNADAVVSGGNNLELGGTITGAAANSLTKDGSGTLIISGFGNTYSGPTIIAGGTLLVNGNIDASSTVSVNGGTLGGTGTVAGPVGVAAGATLAPGTATSTGNLVTGSVTLASGAVFDADIDTGATTADLLYVDGNLNLGGASLSAAILGSAAPGSLAVFTIATYTGTLSGTFNGLAEGATVAISGRNYTIRYADGGNNITLTAPEVIGTPFDNWADTHITNFSPAADDTPAGDPDGDGASNLAEFAFNGDPLNGSDNGKVHLLTADSDFDSPDTARELILTVAVRSGAPAFDGSPSPSSTVDGITYTIQGGTTLGTFDTVVHVVPTPVTAVLPPLPPAGTGYEYRSFSLEGSNGLTGKGFLRAKVTN